MRSLNRDLLLTLYYDPEAHRRVRRRERAHIQKSIHRHRYRIFELVLFGADPFAVHGVLPHFPLLESLKVHNPQIEDDDDSKIFPWLSTSPDLQKLDLAYFVDQAVLTDLSQAIQEVTIRERTPHEAIRTLANYGLITDLVIVLDEGHMQSLAPILLKDAKQDFSHLQFLEITISDEIPSNNREDPITFVKCFHIGERKVLDTAARVSENDGENFCRKRAERIDKSFAEMNAAVDVGLVSSKARYCFIATATILLSFWNRARD